MSLLESHLEQITLSANAIADLSFPPPKIFTNALLNTPDITALIRDTEVHERALFTLDASAKPSQRRATRRGTTFPADTQRETMISRINAARSNRHQSAVARVLGNDMMEEIRRSAGQSSLLFPVAGAAEKIADLRYRYSQISESLVRLEARVADNTAELERMNEAYDRDNEIEYQEPQQHDTQVTDDDIERELKEIRQLERRKQVLEDRVTGMSRDLGGLMR
uniref:DASH complex subunit SPC34 n=1 Tax=Talaromyces marneffei PM1 TaxID=1077442 RepID=A0A093VB88_TALMA